MFDSLVTVRSYSIVQVPSPLLTGDPPATTLSKVSGPRCALVNVQVTVSPSPTWTVALAPSTTGSVSSPAGSVQTRSTSDQSARSLVSVTTYSPGATAPVL